MLKWLRLFRAQTAPATVIPITVGGLFASVNGFWLAYLATVATILHFASFGHNSVLDYLLGFDRYDPSKKHHPLQQGEISVVKALWIINVLLYISGLLLIVYVAYTGSLVGLVFLFSYMTWGYAYNNGLDHLTKMSWLPISLCFGFGATLGYTLSAPSPDPVITILLFSWGFITVLYQIAFEGNLKDVGNPAEVNMLEKYCTISRGRIFCSYVLVVFIVVRWLSIAIAGYLATLAGSNKYYVIAVSVIAAVLSMRNHLRMHYGTRDELLELMGRQEVLVYYHLLFVLLPLYTLPIMILMIYGVAWFLLMNRLLWRSRFGPRV